MHQPRYPLYVRVRRKISMQSVQLKLSNRKVPTWAMVFHKSSENTNPCNLSWSITSLKNTLYGLRTDIRIVCYTRLKMWNMQCGTIKYCYNNMRISTILELVWTVCSACQLKNEYHGQWGMSVIADLDVLDAGPCCDDVTAKHCLVTCSDPWP